MSINAHKEGPPRFVIGLGTRAIQISSRRRVAGRLRIPCPVVANIKQVIYPAGEAQILFTSQVALRPTMLYGLTSFSSLPLTASPL
nr:Uncharacterised protein [Klebsiella pneumoniae]